MNPHSIKEKMAEIGISPNKKLGQNFLINDSVITKIVECTKGLKCNSVVEVGPGLGALTENLLDAGTKLWLIELDRKLAEYWQKKTKNVIHIDALKLDWLQLKLEPPAVLVSNLPYQISSSLVIKLSIENVPLDFMILMFQKEVAQKIMAKPGNSDYGLLSVISQCYWSLEKVTDASPGSFFPPPKVSSRVLCFSRIEKNNLDSNDFLKFVKHCFQGKRKVLWKKIVDYSNKINKVEVNLNDFNISRTTRAEEVSPTTYQEIFRIVNGY